MTTELVRKLRAMYVAEGTNYVQSAADTIEKQAKLLGNVAYEIRFPISRSHQTIQGAEMTVREEFEAWMNKERRLTLDSGPLLAYEAYEAGRESMREDAMQACEEEHLEGPTQSDGDIAYDNAVRDCKYAIKSLP